MKRILLFVPLVIMIALLWRAGGGVGTALAVGGCPASTPTCDGSGVLSDFSAGLWGCTIVGTRSDGSTHASVGAINSDGVGHLTLNFAKNDNTSAATTFSTFPVTPTTGTYCVSSDSTGYILPVGGACPLAIVVNSFFGEVRLLDSSQNRAEVGVCEVEQP